MPSQRTNNDRLHVLRIPPIFVTRKIELRHNHSPMKNRHKLFFLLILVFAFLHLPKGVYAQQKSSKSKSKEKLYEKGEEPNQVFIRNASLINTEHLEFSPAFYQNGIVYVTSRRSSGAVDPKTGETFFELYYAELDIDGMPMKPQEFSINLNSQVHEGPVSFNRSWDKVYFTRNSTSPEIRKSDKKAISHLKIYEATKGKFDWENVRELPFNSDEYSVMHPSLAPDGRRLYFSSDMPGGYGGFDLYMSEKVGDAWSLPINLGPDINTKANEVFPFMHESGILFFSSDGHKGMGGLDLFMVNISGSKWSKVSNLGQPFNSARDDFGFILNPEGNFGFLSSDRAGGYGKDDIYQVSLTRGMSYFNLNLELPTKIISYNEITNERIPNTAIYVFERDKDGFIRGNEAYEVEVKPSLDNPDQLELTLSRKSAAQLGKPSMRTDPNGEAVTYLQAEKDYLIIAVRSGYKTREFQYSTIGEKGSQTVRIPLQESQCASVLGQIRSEKGEPISYAKVRINNKSTGEEQYIRTNIDGKFELCLPTHCQYKITAEKEGFQASASQMSTEGELDLSQPINMEIRLSAVDENPFSGPLHTGSVIVLENIYYDFDKSAIRSGAARELDALATLMKQYPEMTIELTSHTDSRGSTRYNQELSEKRAASAKQYLVSKGIEASRINAKGMGESQIRNRCTDGVKCSEKEHQYNRRTEVRIIRLGAPLEVRYSEGNPSDND